MVRRVGRRPGDHPPPRRRARRLRARRPADLHEARGAQAARALHRGYRAREPLHPLRHPHARPAPCGATVRAVDDYRRPRLRARTPAGGWHRGLHGDGGRLRGTGSGDPVIALNVVPRFQLSLGLRTGGSIIGAREAALLQGIERTKSIKEGAKLAGVSYRTAWATVRTMQRALGRPVVQSRTGGPGGGASVLTEDARELLRFYQDLHRQLDERLDQAFSQATAKP
ncbi:MAG: hypothetical protein DMD53_09440 [Gemmatimonadetes bacterium]|nr:MAG: hypothetical protein DMD53_09440 [Gemmatimonadota bacterium]